MTIEIPATHCVSPVQVKSTAIPGAIEGDADLDLTAADLAQMIRDDLEADAIDEIPQTMFDVSARPDLSPGVSAALAAAVSALHQYRASAAALAAALDA